QPGMRCGLIESRTYRPAKALHPSPCGIRTGFRASAAEVAGHVERQELLAVDPIVDGDVEAEVVGAVHPWVHRQLEGERRRIAWGEGASAERRGPGAAALAHLGVRLAEGHGLVAGVEQRPCWTHRDVQGHLTELPAGLLDDD